jgi:hypothetical protein
MPVTCADGTTAESLEECPQLIDYQADVGYEAEGQFITDDPTTPDVDESMKDIYEAIGGGDWTGQSLKEFSDMYSSDFPTWAGSEAEKQSDLIESQLGMIPGLIDISERGFALESETNKLALESQIETMHDSSEARIRAGGGLYSHKKAEKMKSTYDRVLSGFDLQQEGIDIKRDSSLFDFEGRRLDYQMDLSKVKSGFQDSMWDLISSSLDKYKGCDDPPCDYDECPEGYDACNVCGGEETDASQCGSSGEGNEGSGEQGSQGEDISDTGIDEGPGGDSFENYDDESGGFGEDIEYEDYWDDGEYS